MSTFTAAKEIFNKYNGSYFFMEREGDYKIYQAYNVPREIERAWIQERLDEILSTLSTEINQKNIVTLFSDYASLACQTKNTNAISFMIEFAETKYKENDSYSNLRIIEAILNSIGFLQNSEKKLYSTIIQKSLKVLNSLVENPVTVSEDFKENNTFPEYISTERIVERAKNTIKYWSAI